MIVAVFLSGTDNVSLMRDVIVLAKEKVIIKKAIDKTVKIFILDFRVFAPISKTRISSEIMSPSSPAREFVSINAQKMRIDERANIICCCFFKIRVSAIAIGRTRTR